MKGRAAPTAVQIMDAKEEKKKGKTTEFVNRSERNSHMHVVSGLVKDNFEQGGREQNFTPRPRFFCMETRHRNRSFLRGVTTNRLIPMLHPKSNKSSASENWFNIYDKIEAEKTKQDGKVRVFQVTAIQLLVETAGANRRFDTWKLFQIPEIQKGNLTRMRYGTKWLKQDRTNFAFDWRRSGALLVVTAKDGDQAEHSLVVGFDQDEIFMKNMKKIKANSYASAYVPRPFGTQEISRPIASSGFDSAKKRKTFASLSCVPPTTVPKRTRTMEKITTAACTSSKTIGDVVRDILVKQVQDGLLRSRYPEQQYEYSSRVTQHLSVSDAEYVRRQFARFRLHRLWESTTPALADVSAQHPTTVLPPLPFDEHLHEVDHDEISDDEHLRAALFTAYSSLTQVGGGRRIDNSCKHDEPRDGKQYEPM